MKVAAATLARALTVLERYGDTALTNAELARVLDCTPNHAWIVTRDLRKAGSIRVGGWERTPTVWAPKFDTLVALGDVPKPAPMTQSEMRKRYREKRKADPIRHAEHKRKDRLRARKRCGLSLAERWCLDALGKLSGPRTVHEVAARAGVSLPVAYKALYGMQKREKKLVRIAGWKPTGGRPAPLFDRRVKQPDVPKPPRTTSAERFKKFRDKGVADGWIKRRSGPRDVSIFAPLQGSLGA
jgi:hypothetical protein